VFNAIVLADRSTVRSLPRRGIRIGVGSILARAIDRSLIALLGVFGTFFFSCPLYSGDWEKVFDSTKQILAIDETNDDALFRRLDTVLLDSLARKFEKLSNPQKKALLHTLQSARGVDAWKVGGGGEARTGALLYPVLYYSKKALATPFGRIAFVHELNHILNSIGRGHWFEGMVQDLARFHSIDFLLRLESSALAEEYTFLESVFAGQDREVLFKSASLSPIFHPTTGTGFQFSFNEYALQKLFRTRATEVFEKSKQNYIDSHLVPYRRFNHVLNCAAVFVWFAEAEILGELFGFL
jgi:hypothetical protein